MRRRRIVAGPPREREGDGTLSLLFSFLCSLMSRKTASKAKLNRAAKCMLVANSPDFIDDRIVWLQEDAGLRDVPRVKKNLPSLRGFCCSAFLNAVLFVTNGRSSLANVYANVESVPKSRCGRRKNPQTQQQGLCRTKRTGRAAVACHGSRPLPRTRKSAGTSWPQLARQIFGAAFPTNYASAICDTTTPTLPAAVFKHRRLHERPLYHPDA